MSDELVRMEHINKFFGRVQALNDVTLSVRRSEIVGLLGDNGAGKSTLIKILSGALRANSGDIYMRGNKVDIRNTTDAIAQGIETIYQDSALVTQLSIARNLFLGREPVKGPSQSSRSESNERGSAGFAQARRHHERNSASYPDQCIVRWRTPSRGDCSGDALRQRPDYP